MAKFNKPKTVKKKPNGLWKHITSNKTTNIKYIYTMYA